MDQHISKFKNDNPSIELRSHVIKCDLSDFSSIKSFVEEYKNKVGKLDVLINNAGVLKTPQEYTIDGLETIFGTNH